MEESSRRKPTSQSQRRVWCCSFTVPPSSPDAFANPRSRSKSKPIYFDNNSNNPSPKPTSKSVPNSPQSHKSGLGLVGRILSPGRVSPIDSIQELGPVPSPAVHSKTPMRSESSRAPSERFGVKPEEGLSSGCESNVYDVRLNLRGKRGWGLVLEVNSEVLSVNSELFACLISECRKESGSKMCRIEVPEVENLGVFRQVIELMFDDDGDDDDITKRLLRMGVYRVIDVLEVSAGIMFTRCVLSCLKYLEAVPWTEEEEKKLRSLFTRLKFDDATARDILARLYLLDSADSQQSLARQLVWSITTCTDANARNELKLLVKGLLCRSSVCEKDHHDLNKDDIYDVCQICLGSLVSLFKEASDNVSYERPMKVTATPMIERISRQVDNINWLLNILLDRQMAEGFVDIWVDQGELLEMHGHTSPMVRYELSRVSAILLIAMGTGKLHCQSNSRSRLLQAWFGPMLLDFGWLQRCRKGLDMKGLEEAMGQTLLTLPLKQQYMLFMEWFQYFSKHSTDCPNLSKAFQIWWRRSFLRGCETYAIESR